MIKVKINGQEQSWDGDPSLPLLWYLRDELGLTGSKYGCGQALCGACTVMVDKEAARACITAISDVAGREVTTIEGLHPTGDHPVQKAWRQVNVPQCGFCQAGQIMQAAALLTQLVYPLLYAGILTPEPVAVTVLTLRNLVLCALFVWMVVRVARLPVPVRRRAEVAVVAASPSSGA